MHGDAPDQPTPDNGEVAEAGEAEMGLKWRLLDFTMQPQQQTNWCWAAVAASVDAYFDAVGTKSQCEIATLELRGGDCCANGNASSCNVYHTLFSSLNRVGHMGNWTSKKVAPLADIHTEIDAVDMRPVCFRTASVGGGAHFVAVIGYLPGSETVTVSELVAVEDSWWGSSDVPYSEFVTDYRTGRCTDTYYTVK
jgi:hypothetical protein